MVKEIRTGLSTESYTPAIVGPSACLLPCTHRYLPATWTGGEKGEDSGIDWKYLLASVVLEEPPELTEVGSIQVLS
jgi:hypothetical protein